MLSFRQKIVLSYFLIFIIFIALLSPASSWVVRRVVEHAMETLSSQLISNFQNAPDNDGIIKSLKEQKPSIFFRISIITNERKVLYDSHAKRVLGPKFNQEQVIDHPEIEQAFETGIGYHEGFSKLLGQRFVYLAKAFDFHGKTYILRTAFPYAYVNELKQDFEISFLVLAFVVLLLFSLLTWFIIHYLTRPLQEIITAVAAYQGKGVIPEIKISSPNTGEDIEQLAKTLNSLSTNIQGHIDTLTQERNEKQIILDSLIEGVVALDHNLQITFSNQAADKFLGGKKTLESSPYFALLKRCLDEGKPIVDTLHIVEKERILFLDVICVPMQNKQGAVLVIQDKSSYYKILEMRKDFIANASHELKTPITIIQGFAETLQDNPDLPKEKTKEITERITRNCERMAILVKDLLALADIENIPSYRFQEFDLSELVGKCKAAALEIAPDSNIKISNLSNQPLLIEADPDLLEMAITNLLQNAIRYSHAPADVTINLNQSEEEIFIEVSDKGIGIPEQDLDRIFERFYRVDKARSQKAGGSGLGLAIVETVVKKHAGKITASSKVNEGTTFKIILPKLKRHEA